MGMLEKIKKYNLDEDYNDFLHCIEKLQKGITISALGLYNSGKSSLLNALTDAFDKPNFKVADSVETKIFKSVEFNHMVFLDTPGLNAHTDDDKKAFLGVEQSDIYLFVHNVSTGELNQTEVDYIKKMMDKNKISFKERFYFVLSRVDGVDEEKIESVRNKIKEQFDKFFDGLGDMNIIEVSANNYIKGKKENKKLLIEASKIENLKKLLQDKSKELKKDIEKLRVKQVKSHDFFAKIQELLESKKIESEKLEEQYQGLRQAIENEIKQANETLASGYEN